MHFFFYFVFVCFSVYFVCACVFGVSNVCVLSVCFVCVFVYYFCVCVFSVFVYLGMVFLCVCLLSV